MCQIHSNPKKQKHEWPYKNDDSVYNREMLLRSYSVVKLTAWQKYMK